MPTGKGMYGGPTGTYGKYVVGGVLSSQFTDAPNTEEIQRRRFNRKREPGFTGAGYAFFNYPYMIGSVAAGTPPDTREDHGPGEMGAPDTAHVSGGMQNAGTATSLGGME
jgi:hypothetical protein